MSFTSAIIAGGLYYLILRYLFTYENPALQSVLFCAFFGVTSYFWIYRKKWWYQ